MREGLIKITKKKRFSRETGVSFDGPVKKGQQTKMSIKVTGEK